MATYPVVNTKTGEQKEVVMSYSDPSTIPGVGEVGEWKDKLRKSKPGWNDILKKASKSPGSRVKTI